MTPENGSRFENAVAYEESGTPAFAGVTIIFGINNNNLRIRIEYVNAVTLPMGEV